MASIDPGTAIGSVHLTIADLDRSVRFYETRLGFRLQGIEGRTARLGADGPDLLFLTEATTARRAHGTTGLYHFAILVPSRRDLARALRRFVDTRTTMQGFADHGVSEALYLSDPDGNGIEVYRDRPRDEWPLAGGRLQMGTAPLDVEALLEELPNDDEPWTGFAAATRIGHVHLHVSQLAAADQFYVNVLGFDLMQRYGHAALFVSAGGYHHHVGLNTWAGVGAPAPPRGAIGLRHFTVRMASRAALEALERRLSAAGIGVDSGGDGLLVRDPSDNAIQFTVE
jgi:catechol 2,3-dioxygenase